MIEEMESNVEKLKEGLDKLLLMKKEEEITTDEEKSIDKKLKEITDIIENSDFLKLLGEYAHKIGTCDNDNFPIKFKEHLNENLQYSVSLSEKTIINVKQTYNNHYELNIEPENEYFEIKIYGSYNLINPIFVYESESHLINIFYHSEDLTYMNNVLDDILHTFKGENILNTIIQKLLRKINER